MKITIICTVRSRTRQSIYDYVAELEKAGNQVYFPPRDTPQDDITGLNMCLRMCQHIRLADEIHIFYDKDSQGIHFDMGCAFALGKKWKLVNDPPDDNNKSYIKVIRGTQ